VESVLDQRRYDCRSIVVEEHYVDRDFLSAHDFPEYNDQFVEIPKHTTRLHFFGVPFSPRTLRRGSVNSETFIGSVVVWPTVRPIAGRTLLRPPREIVGTQFIPTADFTIHLAGVELKVPAVPFMQKDRVVAACTSASLWVAMHLMAEKHRFQTFPIARITELARGESPERPIADGLTPSEMMIPLRQAGYAPRAYDQGLRNTYRAASLYAYVASGFPVIAMFDIVPTPRTDPLAGGRRHAVSIVGLTQSDNDSSTSFVSAPDMISHYWVHDDNGVPYERLTVNEEFESLTLSTSDDDGELYEGINIDLLIPMPRHVAGEPIEAHRRARYLRTWMRDEIQRSGTRIARAGTVATRLWASNDLKATLRATSPHAEATARICGVPMPRWVWVTTVLSNNGSCKEVLITDSTAPDGQDSFLAAVISNRVFIAPDGDSLRALENGLRAPVNAGTIRLSQ